MEVSPLKRRDLSLEWPSMTTRLVWRVSTGTKSTRSSWKRLRYQSCHSSLSLSEETDSHGAEGILLVIVLVSIQGSKFYENELKREQQVNQRIEKMMLQKEQITEQQLKKAQAQVSPFQSAGCFKTNVPLHALHILYVFPGVLGGEDGCRAGGEP